LYDPTRLTAEGGDPRQTFMGIVPSLGLRPN
jgi:hypothetical protein